MTAFWQNLFVFFRSAPATLKFAVSGHWRTDEAGNPAGEHQVIPEFFGVCAASGEDPATDDYIIEKLKDLGLASVRVDFTYHSRGQYGERFLRRLIAAKFKVCLHLVQPFAEAGKIQKSDQAREDWRVFVAETLTAYGRDIRLVEIGSTVNRRKWAGYSLPGFLAAWGIAREVAGAMNCPLAGPNVTDFEPFFNIALLNEMKRKGTLPAVHTDNLFVERAMEPEAYDPKIAGKILAKAFRFNLVRKARTLNEIALAFGVSRTTCTHVSWSLRRIYRLLEDIEEKQADYLARYCCLAAASGALEQVYWGPLVGQREGLIDDGTLEFPEIPHVTFYGRARGELKNYRIRPAYYALQTINRFIAGAKYIRRIPAGQGLEVHEFLASDGLLHACWCVNGRRALSKECYREERLRKVKCFSRDGVSLDRVPATISESPLYLMWFGEKSASRDDEIMPDGPAKPRLMENIRFANVDGARYDFITRADLCGVCLPDISENIGDLFSGLKSGERAGFDILRDARNRVWSGSLPGKKEKIVIKLFRPPGPARRFLQRKKSDKALRSWNGAHELLRRGIFTPVPIAFFHDSNDPLGAESWYISDEFSGSFSARNAFTSFSGGADRFEGMKSGELYDQIAIFLRKMHERGVYFRDLSAGNLLFRFGKDKAVEFALIDTARAKFYDKSTGLRQRLCDLMRICHPLCWKGRKIFLSKYMALSGRRYRSWMNIPFYYYDFKHWLKKQARRRRGGRRGADYDL
jgi:hypothetical protein